MTTKFGVSAVTVPPVRHDIRLRACFTSYTSRISIYSQPIPSEFTSKCGKVIKTSKLAKCRISQIAFHNMVNRRVDDFIVTFIVIEDATIMTIMSFFRLALNQTGSGGETPFDYLDSTFCSRRLFS